MRTKLKEAPDDARGLKTKYDAIVRLCDKINNSDLRLYIIDAFYFWDAAYWYPDLSIDEIASMAADGFQTK